MAREHVPRLAPWATLCRRSAASQGCAFGASSQEFGEKCRLNLWGLRKLFRVPFALPGKFPDKGSKKLEAFGAIPHVGEFHLIENAAFIVGTVK